MLVLGWEVVQRCLGCELCRFGDTRAFGRSSCIPGLVEDVGSCDVRIMHLFVVMLSRVCLPYCTSYSPAIGLN